MTRDQRANLTWEEFKTGLYNKYVPKSYRKAKEVEFYNMKQGRLSVTEYDRIFSDMSRYAPNQVDTDEKMAEKFCNGLRHEIKMALASHGGLSYAESLNRALDVEAAMPKERLVVAATVGSPSQQQQKVIDENRWEGGQTSNWDEKSQLSLEPPQSSEKQALPYQKAKNWPKGPFCTVCTKNHFGKCRLKTDKCYNYGRGKHFSRECPHKNVGMEARPNYHQGPCPQLRALKSEPRKNPAPPRPQQQRRPRHSTQTKAFALRRQQPEEQSNQEQDNLAGMRVFPSTYLAPFCVIRKHRIASHLVFISTPCVNNTLELRVGKIET